MACGSQMHPTYFQLTKLFQVCGDQSSTYTHPSITLLDVNLQMSWIYDQIHSRLFSPYKTNQHANCKTCGASPKLVPSGKGFHQHSGHDIMFPLPGLISGIYTSQ